MKTNAPGSQSTLSYHNMGVYAQKVRKLYVRGSGSDILAGKLAHFA